MRIVIDLQGAQTESRFRGIGRYSLSMAKAIVHNRGKHEVIIALNGLFPDSIESIRAEFYGLLPQENIRVWYAPGSVRECQPGNWVRREVAELIREAYLASLQADIVYISSLFEGYADDAVTSIGQFDHSTPVVVSLYDLIPLLNPSQYLQPNPVYAQYYQRKIQFLKQSKSLLAISEYSRQEGVEALDFPLEGIVNVSTSVDENFKSRPLSALETLAIQDKFGITRAIILYTGGADERKNLPRLIKAYAQLSAELRSTHQLVFAGKMPEGNIHEFQQQAKIAGLCKDELLFTSYICDDELVKLYNLCELYVFPSWHEGFGLPALEAMSCGAAVIGARTSSLPEVIGNIDALFDPFSEKSIAEKMTQALCDKAFRMSLIEKGLTQATKFSWNNSAKVVIKTFEQLIPEEKKQKNRVSATHILTSQIAKKIQIDIAKSELIDLAQAIALNHPQIGYKQLFVDVSELSQRDAATGVQRVTRSILMELLNNPPQGYKVEPVYATAQSNGYVYAKKYTARLLGQLDTRVFDEPLVFSNSDVFLGLDLQHHVIIAQADYFEKIKNQNISLNFLVHDLLPITFANYFAKGSSDRHAQWLEVITRFDGIVCVSQTTQDELIAWLTEHYPERSKSLSIAYSHNGADIENSLPSLGLPENHEIIRNTLIDSYSFLIVGTLEPRKGQLQILLAFESLWARGGDVQLVLVGQPGWMVDSLITKILNHPELNKKLFWLNGISDEYLEIIYAASTCLIAASESEGFGLPLIEAAQHQLPIIARDIPVFRELANQYAYFFKGETARELSITIENWIELYKKNEHPKSIKMPWVTWQKSTNRLLEIILSTEEKLPERQLFLDISELVQRDAKSGIQRVVRCLLHELLSLSLKGICVEPVYATLESPYRYARRFTSSFLNCSPDALIDELIEYRSGDVFLGLDLQPQVVFVHQEFYQRMRRDGVQVQFVVYDLLCTLMPRYFIEGAAEGYTQWLSVVAENDGAICISESVANELNDWVAEYGLERLRPFKINWFHLGADIDSFQSSEDQSLPIDAGEVVVKLRKNPSFLMVGTIEPRKAHALTLTAFEQLWADNIDVNLVIVGKQGWMVGEVIDRLRQHPELNKRLFWLEGISDEYLEKIYVNSTCLIAASEGEGFGLPLIEAAQYKLPIIARDIPVFREVAGECAFYFNVNDPFELSIVIQKWLKLYQSKQQPKSDTMPWLTWEQSAIKMKSILLRK